MQTISHYHNMQYEVTSMYETGDIGLCPKVARACPNPTSTWKKDSRGKNDKLRKLLKNDSQKKEQSDRK